jgi:hypothetical protein
MPDPRNLLRLALADVRSDPDALERTLKLIETRRRRRRLAVMSTALALGLAALLLVWVAFRPTSGSISAGLPTASPSATATTSPSPTRCVRATTSGDFDGDGTTDQAELVELVSGPVSCQNGGEVISHLLSQQIAIQFGSGQMLQQPFNDCQPCLTGGGVFSATDLDGDGRDELAIDIGPGASLDDVEFYRVDLNGVHPLLVADPGDPPYVKPGAAILGGGFDSGLQSPIACRANPGGTRELVSVHAENVGGSVEGPWKVHTTTMVLQGDSLVVMSSKDSRGSFSMTSQVFQNGCL